MVGSPLKSSYLNIAAFLPKSRANGPGCRAVVWVQGCPRRCPGCFNPTMLEAEEREMIPVDELALRILATPDIEGVTFSGGEPFEQAAALAELAGCLKERGLNVTVFTGYTYEELRVGKCSARQRLLAASDLLIAGPYMADKPSNRYLCGSDNQELIFLSDNLKNHPDIIEDRGNSLEIIINELGEITVTGISTKS